VPVEPETDKNIAGNDKTAPTPIRVPIRFGEVFFEGLSPNISPERKRIANVPTPTAKVKIAAKIALYSTRLTGKKRFLPAATEYMTSSRKSANTVEIRPTARISKTLICLLWLLD
jgi:hypothetical protein